MVCFLIAFITVQQVCALAAPTVRKHGIFARDCEGTEQLRRILD